MKNMEQQFSEDLMITRSSKSVRDSIPVDLLIDIFPRVPAKSVGRFRCVSKFWESVLGRPDFNELFLTNSAGRPRFFFVLEVNEELFFFSSPQPQNPDESSSLVATRYKGFPNCSPAKISILNGLVCLQIWGGKPRVICNPITGKSITLPEVKTDIPKSHFGYDPINKQFKVLCTSWLRHGHTHRVLALENGKCLWKPIQDQLHPRCSICCDGIFINGVGYYQSYVAPSFKIVVCFDFSSERFSLINMDNDMLHEQHLILFNYKGRLGAHQSHNDVQHKDEFVLWILEDVGNHKWSKLICVPPLFREQIVYKNRFVGVTDTGELVFSPHYLSNPFRILYYNVERKTFTRFNIQGFEEFSHHRVHTSLDYVENMNFT